MANAPKIFRRGKQKPRRDTRKSASKLGYDWRWYKLRNDYIAENPICEHCAGKGITTGPKESRLEVDHIVPFDGIDDPLRLDRDNLQTLCRSCHATKTHSDKRD